MVKKQPYDKNLIDLLGKLTGRLQAAYDRDMKGSTSNPLQLSIDLMALTPAELEKWMGVFEKIDDKQTENISVDQMFAYFEEMPTEYSLEGLI